MAKQDFVNQNDHVFSNQLLSCKAALPGYAVALGITPGEVASQAADADYFDYVLTCQSIRQGDAQQWTAYKNLVRNGTIPGSSAPVVTPFPTTVPTVEPGIEVRFRALAKKS